MLVANSLHAFAHKVVEQLAQIAAVGGELDLFAAGQNSHHNPAVAPAGVPLLFLCVVLRRVQLVHGVHKVLGGVAHHRQLRVQNQVVHQLHELMQPLKVSSDRGLLRKGHFLARFVAHEQRRLIFDGLVLVIIFVGDAVFLLESVQRFLAVCGHQLFYGVFERVEFDVHYADAVVLLEGAEVLEAEGLGYVGVEVFDVVADQLAETADFEHSWAQVAVHCEELLVQHLRALAHVVAAHQALPEGEVLPDFVALEEVDVAQAVEHLGLALPLLDRHEGGLLVDEVRDTLGRFLVLYFYRGKLKYPGIY